MSSTNIKLEQEAHDKVRKELALRIENNLPRATWKEVASDLIMGDEEKEVPVN